MRRFLRFLAVALSVCAISPAMSAANRTTITVYDTHPVGAEKGCAIQVQHFNMVHERWLRDSQVPANRQGDLGAMLILISGLAPCKPILAVSPGRSTNTVTLTMVDLFSPELGLLPRMAEIQIP